MRVKGNVLLARKGFVEKHFGKGAWDKVLDALPESDKTLLRGLVLNVGWFPFKLAETLDRTIVDRLGNGQERVFEEIGRISAEENLGGVHRNFLKPGDPQAFLAQTPEIYGFYYDTGRRVYEPNGPLAGTLTTYDADTFSAVDCLTIVGWHKQALAMCGARDISIREQTCRAVGGKYCRYELAWKI